MRPADPPRGVIRGRRRGVSTPLPIEGARVWPPEGWESRVHHLWHVRWKASFVGEALAHPAVRIIFDDQAGALSARLEGPPTGTHLRHLATFGQTFGISFRPGAFALATGVPLVALTDRVLRLEDVFGPAAFEWQAALWAQPGLDEKVDVSMDYLTRLLPALTAEGARTRDLVERMRVERQILRVDDLCKTAGCSPRTLQRLFREYVGVSPKWCIRRFRLLEAVEQLASPTPPTLAELAGELGYADQAHLTRDFRRAVGQTPRGFAKHLSD